MSSPYTDAGKVLDKLPGLNVRNTNPDDPDHATERLAEDEMQHGVGLALQMIRAGKPGRGLYELVRSVERQNRILGHGDVRVPPTCPCGNCPKSTHLAMVPAEAVR